MLMLAWINEHSAALGVLANIGMLVVWVFYAQLLLNSVLKQRRPRVLINEGKGRDLDAEIFIANMSEEKMFVQLLMAVARTPEQAPIVQTITDVYLYGDDDAEQPAERTTSQGPLSAGNSMRLGSFRQLARQVSRHSDDRQAWASLEIRVVFFYGSKPAPVAATRTFKFKESEQNAHLIIPEQLDTTIMLRPWQRHRIRSWLRHYG